MIYTCAGMTRLRSPSGLPVIRKDCAQLIRCCRHPRSAFNVIVPWSTGGMLGKDAFIVSAGVAPMRAVMVKLVRLVEEDHTCCRVLWKKIAGGEIGSLVDWRSSCEKIRL